MNLDNFLSDISCEIPFYKGYKNCVTDYPIITRGIITENYDRLVSQKCTNRNEIINILKSNIEKKSANNEVLSYKGYIFEETSGTSGTPFRCVKSISERTRLGVELWKIRRKYDSCVNLENYYQFNHVGINQQSRYNPYDFSVDNIERLYTLINKERIRWIHSTPGLLLSHIDTMKKYGIQNEFPNLKFLEVTGHHYSAKEQKMIESFYDAEMINSYGSIETWPVANGFSNKLCINSRIDFVEIIAEDGTVITENNVIGRVVITNLVLKTLPIIRYATGDFASYVDINNGIIELHEGRDINIVKSPRRIFGNVLFKQIMGLVNYKIPDNGVNYVQFIQDEYDQFTMITNYSLKIEIVKSEIEAILCKELGMKVNLSVKVISDNEIRNKRKEKPNIFLRKCEL